MEKMTLDGPRGNKAKDKMPIYDGEDLAPSSKIRKTSYEDISKHSLPKATRTHKRNPRMSKKHSKMKIGSRLCKKNSINSNDVMFGNLSSHQRMLQSLGYNQQEGIDFDQTYAPVARLESIRMLLSYTCYKKIKLHQMDVKSAFLNGFLEEEVYVKQPPGFEHEQHPDYVYKLKKALYGLNEFDMSMMGELNYFLGIQIKQSKDGIYVHQSKYVKNLLTRFGFDNAKPKSTPMNQNSKLTSDEKGKDVDIKKYRGMIGSLLYLTASRPDIMYSVCVCARFQAKPKESYLNAVKRIFRYLSGTINLGLFYPITSTFDLVGYSDADYAGCQTDRKSTSGVCTYLRQSLVSWQNKKQTLVALSTAEGEYLAAGSCCSQILWMIQTLRDFGIKCVKVPIYCDNTSTINISKNPVNHLRTKHIDVRHHFLRDNIAKVFSPTSSQFDLIMVRATRKSGLLANRYISKQDNTVVDLGNESADEVSQTPDSKKLKITLSFDSPDLEQRFTENALDSRPILPGIPVIVREFYANLHEDKFGNCVSTVRDKRIRLNPPFLSSLIKFENPTEIEVFTGKGYVVLPDFSIMDQFKLLLGSDSNVEENPQPPSTTLVTPMGHFLFKIYHASVCPRGGNKSTFSCQDVTVVAIILAGRAFDLSHLILKNMLAASAVKLSIKEVLDAKTIVMSNLHIENGELVRIIPNPPIETPVVAAPSSHSESEIIQMLKGIQDDNTLLFGHVAATTEQVNQLKTEIKDLCNTPKSGVGDPGCHEFHFP
ncbi:hypothetical protein AgCh_000268 [Apium graveolens]